MTDPRLRDVYVQITRIIRGTAWAMELKFSRFDEADEIDLRMREAFRDVQCRAEAAQ